MTIVTYLHKLNGLSRNFRNNIFAVLQKGTVMEWIEEEELMNDHHAHKLFLH